MTIDDLSDLMPTNEEDRNLWMMGFLKALGSAKHTDRFRRETGNHTSFWKGELGWRAADRAFIRAFAAWFNGEMRSGGLGRGA